MSGAAWRLTESNQNSERFAGLNLESPSVVAEQATEKAAGDPRGKPDAEQASAEQASKRHRPKKNQPGYQPAEGANT